MLHEHIFPAEDLIFNRMVLVMKFTLGFFSVIDRNVSLFGQNV